MSIQLTNKNILIISPHPDDEVIGCGGLIAKCKDLKTEINILYMCVGESRQLVTGSTNSKIRIKEINDVSSFGEFKYQILFKDKYFLELDSLSQKKLIDPIEDIIENIKPDIICIPHGESYNQDHRATFNACITALRPIPQKNRHFVETILVYEEPYNWSVKSIFKPNFYLNTENVEEQKIKMMQLHQSQDRPTPFARSKENLIARMRLRGSEVGLYSAEAYMLLRGTLS